ncbi:MAG: hypothetical protein AAGC60_14220 [Acidobacteriota bacterium]
MSITQISVQNVTPQDRRFFVLAQKFNVDQVNSIVETAWRTMLLTTGEFGYGAYSLSTPQLAARSLDAAIEHQLQLVDAPLGSAWTFGDQDGVPSLSQSGGQAPPDGVQCQNATAGSAEIGLYNDYASLGIEIVVAPNFNVLLQPTNRLYFYASVAVVDPQQPIVIEGEVGEAMVGGSALNAQLLLEGSTLKWSFS